jgi:hypothetical protein
MSNLQRWVDLVVYLVYGSVAIMMFWVPRSESDDQPERRTRHHTALTRGVSAVHAYLHSWRSHVPKH